MLSPTLTLTCHYWLPWVNTHVKAFQPTYPLGMDGGIWTVPRRLWGIEKTSRYPLILKCDTKLYFTCTFSETRCLFIYIWQQIYGTFKTCHPKEAARNLLRKWNNFAPYRSQRHSWLKQSSPQAFHRNRQGLDVLLIPPLRALLIWPAKIFIQHKLTNNDSNSIFKWQKAWRVTHIWPICIHNLCNEHLDFIKKRIMSFQIHTCALYVQHP